ncbi:hypothetical protein WA026_014499 [Henosepilachna vigintioctopunctata]|uniref:Chitin-binding type-2 domain-containing protein n=1 Tax=Henosepilachna vigintioctopunctata TaxID=420089 RepID=A0AAW1UM86_9CUCU
MNFAFTFHITCFIGLTVFTNAASKKSVKNTEQDSSQNPTKDEKQSLREDDTDLTQDEQNYSNLYKDNLAELQEYDYPIFTSIPRTGFSCAGKVNWQYYADTETDCQVFHVCESQFSKISFLCPEGSVFNQRHSVCDWWYNVDCTEATDLYILHNGIDGRDFSDIQNFDDSDLNPASTGGNKEPHSHKEEGRKSAKNDSSATKSDKKQRQRLKRFSTE